MTRSYELPDLDHLAALVKHSISLNECELAAAVPGLLEVIESAGGMAEIPLPEVR